jgi:glycosyltransferase (TIGR04182 family)
MKTVVIIPTLNEEKTVGKVVRDFRKELPKTSIIVFDGNSKDRTRDMAKKAGGKVILQKTKGKGNAIQEIFSRIKSDIYILVDGDDTYPASDVHKLIKPVLRKEADMTVGNRLDQREKDSLSLLHLFGNRIITSTLNRAFNVKLRDVLSGYRVISRKVAEDLILLSKGFEIETELTIKTLIENYRIKEIPIRYRARPKGSEAKLNSFNDGYLIIYTIITMFRDHKPMRFFSILAAIAFIIGLLLGIEVIVEWLNTGLITKIPTVVLTSLLIILGAVLFSMGLMLDSMNKKWDEVIHLIKRKRK